VDSPLADGVTLVISLEAIAPAYGALLVALLLAGFGEGFVEGLATPLIQDLHPDEPGRYINLTHRFWLLGIISAVILSGFVLSSPLSWRGLLFLVTLVPFIPAMLVLLPSRTQGPVVHEEQVHRKEVRSHAQAILRHPKFLLFFGAMFFAGGGEFVLSYWTACIGTAIFSGGMLISRLLWGAVGLYHQTTTITKAHSAFCGWWSSFGADFALGHRSMGLLSIAGIPGTRFFTWLTGFLGDRTGLNGALFLVPLSFGIIGFLVWLGGREKGQLSKFPLDSSRTFENLC